MGVALFTMACGHDGTPVSGWAGTMDTLPGGVIIVDNPSSGIWDSSSTWRIDEQMVIGAQEGGGPDVFGSVRGVEADLTGRVYVLDRIASEVRVFNRDGQFVRSVGRAGGGPGEFRMAAGMSWDSEGRLWVADMGNARFSVFDTTGQFLASYRRPLSNVSDLRVRWHGGVDTAGRPYDYGVSRERQLRLLRLESAKTLPSTLAVADTFHVPVYEKPELEVLDARGQIRASMPVPFAPEIVRYLDPRDYVWWGLNRDYEIVQQTFEGDSVRIIRRIFAPVAVTQADLDSALGPMQVFVGRGGRIRGPSSPPVKPAFRWITTDDQGWLWVCPYTQPADQDRVLDVFDPSGRYLGRVRLPFQLTPLPLPVFRGGMVYGVTRDSLGVNHVVVGRVTKH